MPWPGHAGDAGRDAAGRAVYVRPAAIPFPAANPFTQAKAELGRKLFSDPALAGAGDRACASCHDPVLAFQDGRARADGLDGAPLPRRTPFIADAAWGERFFWDGRAASLEEQALGPIQNPREMNQTLDGLVRAVAADPAYPPLFAAAFPEAPRITADTIAKALATFERTLLSPQSRFDRWLAGDDQALDDSARRGLALFTGAAGCTLCHSGWALTDHAFHDIGRPDEDLGRGPILGEATLDHAFKTPSLRNVGNRAPYMHDGSLPTLAAVIEHYARDHPDRPSLSPDLPRIDLSAADKADLVAFLHALDGEAPAPALPAVIAESLAAVEAPPVIRQKDKQFSLAHVRLRAGQTLIVHNDDRREHNVRYATDAGRDYNSGIQEPGDTVAMPFPAPGTYHVYCGIHPKMKLDVDVE